MKKFLLLPLYFAIVCTIAVTSCSGGSSSSDSPDNKVTIKGSILSVTDSQPVQSAQVTLAGTSVTTNSQGEFSITTGTIADADQLAVTCDGYVPTQKPLSALADGTLTLNLHMLPANKAVEIDPGEEHTITTPEGAKVYLPALDNISENLLVSVTYIDSSTDAIHAAPGDMSAITTNGEEGILISRGMLNVDIIGATSGKYYSLADQNKNFTITIPVAGGSSYDTANLPTTIPLWYFDTEKGKWIEEGSADLDGDVYRGTVTHFTPWNVDIIRLEDYARVSGTINDPDPREDETYQIDFAYKIYNRRYFMKKTDFLIHWLEPNTAMTVYITKMSTGEKWVKKITTPGADQEKNIGVFPGEGYLNEVSAFKISVAGSQIDLTWNDPVRNDVQEIEVTYSALGDSGEISTSVAKGVGVCSITGLTFDTYYTIGITVHYTDGSTSTGLQKIVKFAGAYTVTIDMVYKANPAFAADPAPEKRIFIYLDESEYGYYTPSQTLTFPYGSKLLFEAREEDFQPCYYSWYKKDIGDYGYDDTYELTLEDDYTVIFNYQGQAS